MTAAAVLSETEAAPAAWPAVTGHFPLRDAASVDEDTPEIDPAVTWRRIEAWTARRWPARAVTWVVEGPGGWAPRLHPFTLATVEAWDDATGWATATLAAGPLGYVLEAATYRIAGTAGDGATPPADVLEAWRRLHEYELGVARQWWAESADYRTDDAQRPAGWAAKALHLSGAADLLRPYRRLGA